jgi:hypothetical protein
MALAIDEHGAVLMASTDSEFIYAENVGRCGLGIGEAADQPQQDVPTGEQAQVATQSMAWASADYQPEML